MSSSEDARRRRQKRRQKQATAQSAHDRETDDLVLEALRGMTFGERLAMGITLPEDRLAP